jgi:hypothetical protein
MKTIIKQERQAMSRRIDDQHDLDYANRRDFVMPNPETTTAFNHKYIDNYSAVTYSGYNDKDDLGHMDVSLTQTVPVPNPSEKYEESATREKVSSFMIKPANGNIKSDAGYVLDSTVKITELFRGRETSIVGTYQHGKKIGTWVIRDDTANISNVLTINYNLDGVIDGEVSFIRTPYDDSSPDPSIIMSTLKQQPITEIYEEGDVKSIDDGSPFKKTSSSIKSILFKIESEIANDQAASDLKKAGDKLLESTVNDLLPKDVAVDLNNVPSVFEAKEIINAQLETRPNTPKSVAVSKSH